MLQIARSLLRQFRGVLRRSVYLQCPKGSLPPIVFEADSDGLTLRSQHDGVAVSVHVPGAQNTEMHVLPARTLEHFEGRGHGDVTFAESGPGKVQVGWQGEGGVPQMVDVEVLQKSTLPAFPDVPKDLVTCDSRLFKALDDAMQTASREASRFATNKVQLRGGSGQIAATDGRQLLLQSGFSFPWKEDVLVPRLTVFAGRELTQEATVQIGKSLKHVCIQAGPWTVFLPIDTEGRYPILESIIPKTSARSTHIQLVPEDAAFLLKSLSGLPGQDQQFSPVTLDLNGHFSVRARAEGQNRATEVVLARSQVTGQPLRYAVNREFVARALELGFLDATLNAGVPMLYQDDRRKYVFIGLDKSSVVEPGEQDLQLRSTAEEPANPQPAERTRLPVKTELLPKPNDAPVHENVSQPRNGAGFASLLEEAQAMQNMLRDMLLRTNQLITGLKQYHRQTKTMRSTLASLRQLQQLEV